MRIAAACHSGAALSTGAIASSCSGIGQKSEPAKESPGKRKRAVALAKRVGILDEFVARAAR
jgi:hypothetical protein